MCNFFFSNSDKKGSVNGGFECMITRATSEYACLREASIFFSLRTVFWSKQKSSNHHHRNLTGSFGLKWMLHFLKVMAVDLCQKCRFLCGPRI